MIGHLDGMAFTGITFHLIYIFTIDLDCEPEIASDIHKVQVQFMLNWVPCSRCASEGVSVTILLNNISTNRRG